MSSHLAIEQLEVRAVPSASPAELLLGDRWALVAAPHASAPLPIVAVVAAPPTPSAMAVAAAHAPAKGPIVHTVVSPFQRTATQIRVLLPDGYDPSRTYRTIYVLPVEPGNGARYGDGLQVIKQANLHNTYQTIFVAPTFSDMPWYADNIANPRIRQESHLVKFVIPFIEQRYSVSHLAADRLLLGFSKSGYGAFSLLLRNPDVFGKAYSWDSPVAMTNPDQWDYLKILGSRPNFEHYRISRLLTQQAAMLASGPPRLFLAGYSVANFRSDHAKIDALMRSLHIPHGYDPGRYRAHAWNSGWVPGGVSWLVS